MTKEFKMDGSTWARKQARMKAREQNAERLRLSAGAKVKVTKTDAQKYYARLRRYGVSKEEAKALAWIAAEVWERRAA